MDDVRVLVVDDHEPFRDALASLLSETAGFVVVAAVGTGEESVVAVPELRPALVLMDVHLPRLSGIDAARVITGRTDAPVVLLMSTYAEDEIDWSGCGAAGFIGKSELTSRRLRELWEQVSMANPVSPEEPRRWPRGT